ncbi:MAG: hypothetical protein QOH61_1531 [Chloroflexota bacterium]|jgi:hypothetical protein|nr:hypothetical protein [Chloroflexota bacterium]
MYLNKSYVAMLALISSDPFGGRLPRAPHGPRFGSLRSLAGGLRRSLPAGATDLQATGPFVPALRDYPYTSPC